MADIVKNINARLSLKIDTLEAWLGSSLVLNAGEVALATVAASAGTGLEEPVIMAKVGNGTNTFSELDWNFHAKASDVIAACKTTEGLTAFVNNVIAGNNLATAGDLTALAGRVTTAEGAITTLNGDDTTAGSVANSIKTAIAALDATVASADVEAGKGLKVTVVETDGKLTSVSIEGSYDEVYAAKVHNHVVADITDFDASVKAYDYATKAEAKGYADAKDGAIAAAQSAADAAQGDVDALEITVADHGTRLATAEGEIDALQNQILGLTGAMHFIGTSTSDPLAEGGATVANVEAFNAGDVVLYDGKEYIYDGSAWILFGDEGSYLTKTAAAETYATKADVKTTTDGLAGRIETLEAAADDYDTVGSAAAAEAAAKAYADSLASNYDAAGSAAAAEAAAKSYADGLAGNYDAKGSAATAESNAKAYADSLAVNYDAAGSADQALTDAKAYAKEYADGLAGNYDAAGSAATAEANAKAYADGLAGNYDAKGSAATAEENAKAYAKSYADGLAGNYDAAGSAATAESNAKAYAKEYADGLAVNYDAAGSAASALEAAKKYADELNHEDTKYTAKENGGLKLNADNSFEIDETITFVINCGNSSK